MSDTPVVDLHHWRAARGVESGPAEAPGSASTSGDAPATVIALPTPDSTPAVSGAPRSVFGPVMAFGLVPREPEPRLSAVGEGEPPLPSRTRQLRARHLADARGASKGPAR